MQAYKNIDEFVSTLPEASKKIAENIRQVIHDQAPEAIETISYGIPTFKYKGKNLVHFSVYQKHVGFYPGAQAIVDFADTLKGYKTSKGTVQFPINESIPYELIKEIVKYRLQQI